MDMLQFNQFAIYKIVAEDFDEDTKWDKNKNSQTERVEGVTSSSNSKSSDGTSSVTIATLSQQPYTSTKQYVASDSSRTSTSDRSATYVNQNEEYKSEPMISIQAVIGILVGAFTAVCLGTAVVFWYLKGKNVHSP